MSKIILYNGDNLEAVKKLQSTSIRYDLIYSDMIYQDEEIFWINELAGLLKKRGIFIVQTDYHTVAEVKIKLDNLGLNFVNWISVKFEWGGTSKRYFPRKTDFILVYSNGNDYKFHYDRVLIPKATAGTKLDKKGTGLKIPCDFWEDMSFSTLAKERVKLPNGHNIQWQKPLKMMRRLMTPFLDIGDSVLDSFMGTGTTGVVALDLVCDYTGLESDPDIFKLAEKRIYDHKTRR